MDIWKDLLSSKKFMAMVIGFVATFLSRRFDLPEAQVHEIVALVVAFIVGQGISDNGKEAAKIAN